VKAQMYENTAKSGENTIKYTSVTYLAV